MLVFDLETDGLFNDVTRIHCLVIFDSTTDETYVYNDQGDQEPIVRGVQLLEEADIICGHNVINFDVPILQKFYSWFDPKGLVVDTLLLSRLYYTDRLGEDHKTQTNLMPGQMFGRHSLASYGYRLGEYKGEFGKTTDWKDWSQEMQDYCRQDVAILTKLWTHFQKSLKALS